MAFPAASAFGMRDVLGLSLAFAVVPLGVGVMTAWCVARGDRRGWLPWIVAACVLATTLTLFLGGRESGPG